MKCDAGAGTAAYVVEIPRLKTKDFAVFRLCTLHADNVRLSDRNAAFFEMRSGARPCGDQGTWIDLEQEEDD